MQHIQNIFNEVDANHPQVDKVLLLGIAGIGKTTLLHYLSYRWGEDKLWEGKFDYVLRVRLKTLLNELWGKDYTRDEKKTH